MVPPKDEFPMVSMFDPLTTIGHASFLVIVSMPNVFFYVMNYFVLSLIVYFSPLFGAMYDWVVP
jgi:hypothetical protein